MPHLSPSLQSLSTTHATVYGPVQSWRFGRSLGIDPIGETSVCSYHCVYCQLGVIEKLQCDCQVFVESDRIQRDLQTFAPWDVDIITISGSGEPTLALNLGDIIRQTQAKTQRPVGVLTNGSLLDDPQVRDELAAANTVAVKLDAMLTEQWRRINRPVSDLRLTTLWAGLEAFRQQYRGRLAIQTMLLSPWNAANQTAYIHLMRAIAPDEIQLNTPTRPKPNQRLLDARGNDASDRHRDLMQWIKPVSIQDLKAMSDRITAETHIPTRYPTLRPSE
jgi:wyosine [tRNA(Phe)-imidazoG37] synthetase (radical SAM superfamily)